MTKLIINLAPTGMVPTKEMTPHVPITPEEIVSDILRCADMGVSMVHLHARGDDGSPTHKKEIYVRIIAGVRKQRPDLIIVVSTSGRQCPEFDKRSEVLNLVGEVKPDMASLTLSSLNFLQTPSINSPETIMKLAATMQERGIKPELEIFDVGMVNYAKYLIQKGLILPPYYFNIILGSIASAQASLLHAGLIISELPADSYFSLTGIGNYQRTMNGLAVVVADGVRVGLEDNIWLDRERQQLATNADLVERAVQFAAAMQRPIATASDVRKLLNLSN